MAMYKQRYKEEIKKQRDDLYAPINKLVDDTIRLVCEREKITILFDSAQPIYVSAQCVDLTPLVKAELGL